MQFKKRLCLFIGFVLLFMYAILHIFKLASKTNKHESRKIPNAVDAPLLLFQSENSNRSNLKDSCDPHGSSAHADIQMLNLYRESIKFDNPDGGAWKQGWNVQVDESRWNTQNKLKVFVVPHSHNDPGWTRTFEQYYEIHTRNIFKFMVKKLSERSSLKFIWAEVSFLSLWWAEASNEEKRKFRRLLDNGQIEIVSGGWVMPDEANSHYYSLIQQLTHGHQWLEKNLNYKPKRSWCIDPFGTSPTMPYLLQHYGLESLVIQRTHYSIKKYLAKNKQLEFRWRQFWDLSGKFDFMTHMMPFYNYDVPHTCGPDPSVCCQFDFRRSFNLDMVCPWKKQPQMITERNVAYRAEMLLDQYRKKAELYSTNILLVPLGDDFRYDFEKEWDLQYTNYRRLFDYMNNNPSWYVQAQFGTIDDYFEALKMEKIPQQFPSLSGDFFTYADRDDHYWSGYFTSRPFYKQMDRELISYLRGAEILHALAWKSTSLTYSEWMLEESSGLIKYLRDARACLSLFQHHDGITGTAKDYVVDDYSQKLRRGMTGAQHVLQQSLNFLLSSNKVDYKIDPQRVYFDLKKSRKTSSGNSKYEMLKVDEGSRSKRIVVVNSLTRRRIEIVSVKVADYENVQLYDSNNRIIPYQMSPFCELNEHNGDCFLLYFEVDVAPLSTTTYFLTYTPGVDNRKNIASVTVLNSNGLENEMKSLGNLITYDQSASDFSIHNDKISVTFQSNGLMKAITLKQFDMTILAHMSFIKYSCKHGKEMCGAYLFLPAGEGRIENCETPLIKIIRGKLVSSVIVYCNYVIQAVHVYNSTGFDAHNIEIQNLVDIKTETNSEIAMRLSTGVKNNDIFYTDLNGMQIAKRQYLSKLPLQANYYPMPTSIYIEDEKTRITFVSAQPLGASSLKSGELEVMQDRRLNQDDNLGLGQGVLDNRPVLHIFKLVVEKRIQRCQKSTDSHLAGHFSVRSYSALNSILYPPMIFVHRDMEPNINELLPSYTFRDVDKSTDVDVHLVSVNTIDETRSLGVVLHRTDLDRCFHQDHIAPVNHGLVQMSSYFPIHEDDVVFKSPPSFNRVESRINDTNYLMCVMDLVAFYVTKLRV